MAQAAPSRVRPPMDGYRVAQASVGVLSLAFVAWRLYTVLAQGIYGSDSDLYSVRLRTTTTSANGTPETATPPGSLTTTPTHVVLTRDTYGNRHIYLDGELVTTGFDGGDLSTRLEASEMLVCRSLQAFV